MSSAALLLLASICVSNLTKLCLRELFFGNPPVSHLVQELKDLSRFLAGFFVETVHEVVLTEQNSTVSVQVIEFKEVLLDVFGRQLSHFFWVGECLSAVSTSLHIRPD